MPRKSYYKLKKRIPRSTRLFYRRSRIPKMMKGGYWYAPGKVQNQIHEFKRMTQVQEIYNTGSPGLHTAYQFQLSDLPNHNEWVNLYDSYRITKIVLRIEPAFNMNTIPSIATSSIKFLRVVHDYDDSNLLTQESDYFEYGNLKNYDCSRPVKITLYPKVSAEVYRTAVSTGYEQRSSPWLDLSGTGDDIPHYGIKIFYPQVIASDNALQYRIFATFHVQMRQTK